MTHWTRHLAVAAAAVILLVPAGFAGQGAEAPAPDASGAYALDGAHSTIGFSVEHLGINMVAGRFNEFTGAVTFDSVDVTKSSVTFSAKATSIDTGVGRRDDHLRGADFFDVAKYPTIDFVSSKIVKRADGMLVAHGNLTMHGVTKAIEIPFRVRGPIKGPGGKLRFGVEGDVKLDRQAFGIVYGIQKMESGSAAIGTDVHVMLRLEVVKQDPAAKPAT